VKIDDKKEKRIKKVNSLPWKEAILKYPDGIERCTRYKIFDGMVYLRKMTGVTMNEYQELCIQARLWDDKERIELKKLRPAYITHLVNNGFLYTDGERVISNLDLTAAEYVKYTEQPVSSKFLMETFRQDDGNEYSNSACSQARDYANTNIKNKH